MTVTHQMSDTAEYNIWIGIKTRCYNPKCKVFKHYGGRGITMCDHWKASFENFYADMGPRPSQKHSIERIDNNAPYAPTNCRWADDVAQMNNTRSNHCLTYQETTQSIADWSRQLKIPYSRLSARLARGLPTDKVLSPENLSDNKIIHRITYDGKTKSISDWAKESGISPSVIYDRVIQQKWSVERALTTSNVEPYAGRPLTFNGETKNLSDWATRLGISVSALSKRLRKGWTVEKALTTPAHTEKITHY